MSKNIEELELKDKELNVEIWKQIIEVQMHFNELKAKNRRMFVSILTALLAVIGYILMSKNISDSYFLIFNFKLYSYSIAIFISVIFSFCFYILDHSTHTLLKGSVECGKKFETTHFNEKLTSNIIEEVSHKEPFSLLFFELKQSKKDIRAKHKLFYGLIISALFIFFIISLIVPLKVDQNNSKIYSNYKNVNLSKTEASK